MLRMSRYQQLDYHSNIMFTSNQLNMLFDFHINYRKIHGVSVVFKSPSLPEISQS